ncbi:MAG TPA: class IV adenylate cyclase [Tepidisphaeraceae bacterium]|jgi:adenylate cyclase class 2
MLEIEAKLRIADFSPLRAQLEKLGAVRLGQRDETNIFFDTPDRRLLAADKGLRLRHQRDLATQHDQFILTFKGPNLPGPLKQREERELTIESATSAIALLKSLGYEPIFQFQKRREIWQLNDCEIALDELPDLGKFVEIEGPSENAIQSLLQQLSLQNEPLIRESYVALLLNSR